MVTSCFMYNQGSDNTPIIFLKQTRREFSLGSGPILFSAVIVKEFYIHQVQIRYEKRERDQDDNKKPVSINPKNIRLVKKNYKKGGHLGKPYHKALKYSGCMYVCMLVTYDMGLQNE